MFYNTTTGVVTCVSTGGPVTALTWNKRGGSYSQSKIIVDTASATYHNLLYISSSTLSDYTGTFTCNVSNSRGIASSISDDYKIMWAENKSFLVCGSIFCLNISYRSHWKEEYIWNWIHCKCHLF